jgi:hypothetical protein
MIIEFKGGNSSENDIKKLVRLTTKASEYRIFITDLERLERNVQKDNINSTNVQNDTFEDAIPVIGETINTVGALKAFLNTLKDDDLTIMEAIALETGDVQDLYPFHMDVIDGIELTDGRTVSEIRFCQESNVPEDIKDFEGKYKFIKDKTLPLSDETPQLIRKIDFSLLRTQKKTLIEIIDDMEKKNVEYYKNDVSNLDGILNLIDCIQDFATDVMGLNPIDVYDFDLEELREDIIKPNKTNKSDKSNKKYNNDGYDNSDGYLPDGYDNSDDYDNSDGYL